MAWAEVAELVRWDVSCTAVSCATAYRKPLAPTEGGFFLPVCQSFTEIHCSRISFYIYPPQHSSLLGSSPLSFLVHHQWVTGLEKQFCWFEVHWFKFRVCWYDQEEKWHFGRSFHWNGRFICIPVLPIKGQLHREKLQDLAQKLESELQLESLSKNSQSNKFFCS